jgi:serine O-acetyltransferase
LNKIKKGSKNIYYIHTELSELHMIMSKSDYQYYLKADKISLGRKSRFPRLNDDIWKFERLLRKVEYFLNCKKGKLWYPYRLFLSYRMHAKSRNLGFTIHPNSFGPGLSIGHVGTIVVNSHARIGANCRIHVCVSIGTKAGCSDKAPIIGDNVYIGPGAKIFGDIIIADGIAIGANSVVNKSHLDPNVTIAGIPARKVSEKGSQYLLINATEILDNNKQSLLHTV